MADFSVGSTGLTDINSSVAFTPSQGVRQLGKEATVNALTTLGQPVIEGYQLSNVEEQFRQNDQDFFNPKEAVEGADGHSDQDRKTLRDLGEKSDRLSRGSPYQAVARWNALKSQNIAMYPHLAKEIAAISDKSGMTKAIAEADIKASEKYYNDGTKLGFDMSTARGERAYVEYQAAEARHNSYKYATQDALNLLSNRTSEDFDTLVSGPITANYLEGLENLSQEERNSKLAEVKAAKADLQANTRAMLVEYMTPIFGEEKARRSVGGMTDAQIKPYLLPLQGRLEHAEDVLLGTSEGAISDNTVKLLNNDVMIDLERKYPSQHRAIILGSKVKGSRAMESVMASTFNIDSIRSFINATKSGDSSNQARKEIAEGLKGLNEAAKQGSLKDPEAVSGHFEIVSEVGKNISSTDGSAPVVMVDSYINSALNKEVVDMLKKKSPREFQEFATGFVGNMDSIVTNKLIPDMMTSIDEIDGDYSIGINKFGGVVMNSTDPDNQAGVANFNKKFSKRTANIILAHHNLAGGNYLTGAKAMGDDTYSVVLGTNTKAQPVQQELSLPFATKGSGVPEKKSETPINIQGVDLTGDETLGDMIASGVLDLTSSIGELFGEGARNVRKGITEIVGFESADVIVRNLRIASPVNPSVGRGGLLEVGQTLHDNFVSGVDTEAEFSEETIANLKRHENNDQTNRSDSGLWTPYDIEVDKVDDKGKAYRVAERDIGYGIRLGHVELKEGETKDSPRVQKELAKLTTIPLGGKDVKAHNLNDEQIEQALHEALKRESDIFVKLAKKEGVPLPKQLVEVLAPINYQLGGAALIGWPKFMAALKKGDYPEAARQLGTGATEGTPSTYYEQTPHRVIEYIEALAKLGSHDVAGIKKLAKGDKS